MRQLPSLNFEAIEHARNMENLAAMEQLVADRSDSLAERIATFSEQFKIPEDRFWQALDDDPIGPLAAVLATYARRQNIHEEAAADYIEQMDHVEDLKKLPSQGRGIHYVSENGQIVLRSQLGRREPRPSEALDFTWQTGDLTCYAAQKYTKEGGGNQDSRFDETIRLLSSFRQHQDENVAMFVLVDGAYYTENRLEQLQELAREESPRSYVTSINDLQQILHQIVDAQ